MQDILISNGNIYDILYGNEIPYNKSGLFVNGITPYPDTYDQTSRLWYKGAISKDGIFITEPYVDANTGNICITCLNCETISKLQRKAMKKKRLIMRTRCWKRQNLNRR